MEDTTSPCNGGLYVFDKPFRDTTCMHIDSTWKLRRHLTTEAYMFLKHLSATSPASKNSTWKKRRHLATEAYIDLKNLSATSPASIDSTSKIRRIFHVGATDAGDVAQRFFKNI